jgi:hypothetical protein
MLDTYILSIALAYGIPMARVFIIPRGKCALEAGALEAAMLGGTKARGTRNLAWIGLA